eukprot:m.79060 g.79060  ORF g.79060 m.79060 type:complete len:282 (-) comp25176_c0_seq1:316-1161(-)
MADELLAGFMSMGTTDHTTLIQQFLAVINGAPPDAAQFFLEANNMNLQAAIASYLDQGGTGAVTHAMSQTPLAEFMCDVTIGEGEEVPPGTVFQKTWRVRNIGDTAWPAETTLNFMQGERLGGPAMIGVPPLEPGAVTDLSVSLQSPSSVGMFAASWRLGYVYNGVPSYFGEEIWVVITVSEGGMLDALQRMHASNIGSNTANSGLNSQSQSHFNFGNNNNVAPIQPTQPTETPPAGHFAVPSFGSLASHSFGANTSQLQQQTVFQNQQHQNNNTDDSQME